jgi:hypothetical protein
LRKKWFCQTQMDQAPYNTLAVVVFSPPKP